MLRCKKTMKCALHLHTNLSDGAYSPEELIRVYADLGFGCVCITDHDFLLRDDYVRRVLGCRRRGLLVLAGVEADYEPWHHHHLVRVMGEKETLHILAHPSAYYLSVADVNRRLKSEPFPIEAVEVTHRGFYTPDFDIPEIEAVKVASDDAHEPHDCGRAWVEVPDTTDPDRVIRSVRAGDCALRFYRNSR